MRGARVRPMEEMYKDAKLGKFFNFPPRKAARRARYDRGEGGELASRNDPSPTDSDRNGCDRRAEYNSGSNHITALN